MISKLKIHCTLNNLSVLTPPLHNFCNTIFAMAKPPSNEEISDFLTEQRDEAPAEDQHLFLTFEDLWDRKLWHQLTDRLLEFFSRPESASQRLPIYNTFIVSFADKINQLKLVKLALSAATQSKGETQVERRCSKIV